MMNLFQYIRGLEEIKKKSKKKSKINKMLWNILYKNYGNVLYHLEEKS